MGILQLSAHGMRHATSLSNQQRVLAADTHMAPELLHSTHPDLPGRQNTVAINESHYQKVDGLNVLLFAKQRMQLTPYDASNCGVEEWRYHRVEQMGCDTGAQANTNWYHCSFRHRTRPLT